MMGSAAATLASYGVMAFVLGIYSKRVMEVNYHMPASFGLMGFCAMLVYSTPAVSAWLAVSYVAGSFLLMIPGYLLLLVYYFSERS